MVADGTWAITLEGPTGPQNLTFTFRTNGAELAGTLVNPSMGVKLEVLEGVVDGDRLRWRAVLTEPVEMETAYDAVVAGDVISGNVAIQGMGTYAFSGRRT